MIDHFDHHSFLFFEEINKDLTRDMHDACKYDQLLEKCVYNLLHGGYYHCMQHV